MRDPIPSTNLLKDIPEFAGFPPAAQKFLAGLALHNDKIWFDKHRDEYEAAVLQPMRAFVLAIGQQLRPVMTRVVADPRVGGSIFRLARDIRFSADKSPYKTWAAARWWDGSGPNREAASGFYFDISAEGAWAGGGIYMFEDDQLVRYRKALSDPKALRALRTALKKADGLEIGGHVLKRIPRGFEASHPAGGLLLHKGFYAGRDLKPKATRSAALVDEVVAVYRQVMPLNRWLDQHVVHNRSE